MPRGSRDTIDDYSQAGAYSRNRISNDAQQLDRRNLAVAQDERAQSREDRMAESQALNDEVQRWKFEKEKALDANAARMKIETDKQAIAANEELFKINTAEDDAPEKLADWGAKYFRVLDEKTGDPRLIRQFQINQSRAEGRQIFKARADEVRATRMAKDEEGVAAWEVANGVDYPRRPDGKPNHVAAGLAMRAAAKQRGLTERTTAAGGVTFGNDASELANVTDSTQKIEPGTGDINTRTVTSKIPATELKRTTPLSGKAFLDSLKR